MLFEDLVAAFENVCGYFVPFAVVEADGVPGG